MVDLEEIDLDTEIVCEYCDEVFVTDVEEYLKNIHKYRFICLFDEDEDEDDE